MFASSATEYAQGFFDSSKSKTVLNFYFDDCKICLEV